MIRAGRYWIPHWYKASHWIAYWDVFGRPASKAALCSRHSGDLVVRPRQGGETRTKRISARCGYRTGWECHTERMTAYIIRRLLFMVPTLFGIMLVSFVVVQFAPGGPVERVIAQLSGSRHRRDLAHLRLARRRLRRARPAQGASQVDAVSSKYRGAQGSIRNSSRTWKSSSASTSRRTSVSSLMLWNYARFDFGKSYFRDVSVLQLIKEKLPVSMSLGIWMTLLTYLISIPLGIRKAMDDGSRFDMWTSGCDHHRLRHSGLSVRDPADHPVCRRLVLRLVPAARAHLRQLGAAAMVAARSSIISGI